MPYCPKLECGASMSARRSAHMTRPEQSNASGPAPPIAYGAPTFDSAAVTAASVAGARSTATMPPLASIGAAAAVPGIAAQSAIAASAAFILNLIAFLGVLLSRAPTR